MSPSRVSWPAGAGLWRSYRTDTPKIAHMSNDDVGKRIGVTRAATMSNLIVMQQITLDARPAGQLRFESSVLR
ncbi:MAG: hypothetical protein CK431_08320 [Mycobacterium sp.]|nr:MAG: hypothetical protein CK431_08320 [Mycobacterium sp.]